MEIGIFINEKWEAAILNITDSALLIKCQSKTLIIAFKEIVYYRIYNDSYIHVGYMERLNGDAWKKEISINGENNEEIINKINEKRNGTVEPVEKVNEEQKVTNGGYVINNNTRYNNNVIESNAEISEENIKKQNEMNQNMEKPKNGYSIIIFIIIGIILFCGLTYLLKATLLNSKENLIQGGGMSWANVKDNNVIAYQFRDNNKCKFLHKSFDSVTEEECKYEIKGHKIEILFEDNLKHTYEWNLKYKLQPDFKEPFKVVLYLKGDNEEEFTSEMYSFSK